MQQISKNHLIFQEEADTFDLSVILHEGKLTVTLKDNIDWIVYFKQYTDNDIGKEIHRKMDLVDIFSAFSQSKIVCGCDEENIRQIETGIGRIKEYQFGSIVQNEGVPCFSIEKGGQVTVYWMIVDKRLKKQVTFQSKLRLTKIQKLSQEQILNQRVQKQKRKLQAEFRNQILKQKMEFQKRINSLETENKQILKQNAKKFFTNLTSLPQSNKSYFKLGNLRLQYKDQNAVCTHFIFNYPISFFSSQKFKIRIIQTKEKSIIIGVADYFQQKDKRTSWKSGNAVGYYGVNGCKCPQKITQGEGFKKGDTVEVVVERQYSRVKYIINGKLSATQINYILGERSRVFMPFVEMFHTNDVVEWLED